MNAVLAEMVAVAISAAVAALGIGYRLGRGGRDIESLDEQVSKELKSLRESLDMRFNQAKSDRKRLDRKIIRVEKRMDQRFRTIHDLLAETNHCGAEDCPYCEPDDDAADGGG